MEELGKSAKLGGISFMIDINVSEDEPFNSNNNTFVHVERKKQSPILPFAHLILTLFRSLFLLFCVFAERKATHTHSLSSLCNVYSWRCVSSMLMLFSLSLSLLTRYHKLFIATEKFHYVDRKSDNTNEKTFILNIFIHTSSAHTHTDSAQKWSDGCSLHIQSGSLLWSRRRRHMPVHIHMTYCRAFARYMAVSVSNE